MCFNLGILNLPQIIYPSLGLQLRFILFIINCFLDRTACFIKCQRKYKKCSSKISNAKVDVWANQKSNPKTKKTGKSSNLRSITRQFDWQFQLSFDIRTSVNNNGSPLIGLRLVLCSTNTDTIVVITFYLTVVIPVNHTVDPCCSQCSIIIFYSLSNCRYLYFN